MDVSLTNSLDRTWIMRNGLKMIPHAYDSAKCSSLRPRFEHMSGDRVEQNCRCVEESAELGWSLELGPW